MVTASPKNFSVNEGTEGHNCWCCDWMVWGGKFAETCGLYWIDGLKEHKCPVCDDFIPEEIDDYYEDTDNEI